MFSSLLKSVSDDYRLNISAKVYRNEEVYSGQFFQDEPCLAIERREGKKIVIAIGSNARALNGAPNVEILYPFGLEDGHPDQVDALTALINHSLFEVSSRLPKKALAPTLSIFTQEEMLLKPKIQQEILERCGFRKVTVHKAEAE